MLLYGARVKAMLLPTRTSPLLTPALPLLPPLLRSIPRCLRAPRAPELRTPWVALCCAMGVAASPVPAPGLPTALLLLATLTPASLSTPLLRCGRVPPLANGLPSRTVVALLPHAAPVVPLLRGMPSLVQCAFSASCLAAPPRVGMPPRAAMRGVAAAR